MTPKLLSVYMSMDGGMRNLVTSERINAWRPRLQGSVALFRSTKAQAMRCEASLQASVRKSHPTQPQLLTVAAALSNGRIGNLSPCMQSRRSDRLARVSQKDLRLDEDYQGLGQHAVRCHRFGHRLVLHRAHDDIHVGNVNQHRHSSRVLRFVERSDVGDAEGSEDFFALRRG